MGKNRNLAIGDVIKGDFSWTVWGYQNENKAFILNQEKQVLYSPGFDPDKIRYAPGGYSPVKKSLPELVDEVGLRLNDKKFVVVYTNLQGGGTGMGPHDIFPDGWNVVAQMLKDDGTFDPKGLKIQFYQTGCFTCMIPEPDIVGKMTQTFIPAGP